MTSVFDEFDDAITLNSGQHSRARQALNGLRTVLRNPPGELVGAVDELVEQGSFARGTILKPVEAHHTFDVDALLVGKWELSNGWFSSRIPPREALRRLGVELRRHHNYASKVVTKDRCVRIDFAGAFHLDVVPAIPDNKGHLIPDKTEDRWVRTNPIGLQEWFRNCDKIARGRAGRLCRFVREWKRTVYKTRGPSGLMLDVLVADIAADLPPDLPNEVADLLYLFEALERRVNEIANLSVFNSRGLPNPCMPQEDLARGLNEASLRGFHTNIARALHGVERAATYRRGRHPNEAWRAVFGARFPL